MEKVRSFGSKQVSIVKDYDLQLWVKSYDTIVAHINDETKTIDVLQWDAICKANGFNNKGGETITKSATTTRHINLVAKTLNFKIKY